MKPASDSSTFVLPPALLAELEAAASEEHRSVADIARDMIEHGLGERRWQAHAAQEWQRARELGLPDDDQPMTDEYRQVIRERIAQGLQSLREGKGTDGEAFMAQMVAELDELERQGQ
jgi:predicted transcriptional regulator